MAPKVLVADKLSCLALDIFARRGIEADIKTDLSRDELIKVIPAYDALAAPGRVSKTRAGPYALAGPWFACASPGR